MNSEQSWFEGNWKKVLKVVLPILIIVGVLGGGYKYWSAKPVEGEKTIEIHFYDSVDEENIVELGTLEIILVDEDDSLFLGDALDHINEDEGADYKFFLSEPSEFGRMVDGIEIDAEEFMNTDSIFWMIDSDNNTQCQDEGFCSGIDSQTIMDEDVFEFNYSIPEW